MKRLVLFLGITVLIAAFTMALPNKPQPPKTYSVTLTNEQWGSVLNGLEAVKSAVKLSNMPANQSTFICDSLIVVYQMEFNRQITVQKQAEANAAQQKKDTSKQETKKHK